MRFIGVVSEVTTAFAAPLTAAAPAASSSA
jgi:hypothetical protein